MYVRRVFFVLLGKVHELLCPRAVSSLVCTHENKYLFFHRRINAYMCTHVKQKHMNREKPGGRERGEGENERERDLRAVSGRERERETSKQSPLPLGGQLE